MDKSCRSFFFWTFLQQRAHTCVASRYCGRNSLQTVEKKPKASQIVNTHTHTHTHISVSLPHDFSLRLMKCDHSDSRDPLREPTEEQVTPSIFLKKTHTHTHSGMQEYLDSAFVFDGIGPGACVRLCVRYRPQLSVAYGNFLPPTILHLFPWYHSPPSLWSASRWHSCLASFITVPWWMRRSHLHNALLERETEMKAETKGNTLELWTPIWTLWDTLFLMEVKRQHLCILS